MRQREQLRLKLTTYSSADYKPGAAGAEIARLLVAISNAENAALSELVLLHDDVAAYCRADGKGDSDLRIVAEFSPFQSAKKIASGCPGSKRYYVFVDKLGDGSAGLGSIHDVRFFVNLGTRSWQVLEIITGLLQFWELFLRHHTTLGLTDFSRDVQSGLLGRVTDTVFYEAVNRQLTPIPVAAAAGASVEVLQEEISQRLGNVAFYLEEREILRPGLERYTGRMLCEASNENAKRDITRIRNVEKGLLHELIHLRDTVRKWLDKKGRASELAVVEGFRPFRIGANLVNVLKHGVRGRNQDCAVIELDMHVFKRVGREVTPDDNLLDVIGYVNYNGELFSLTQLIEDISQLWELFLRQHLQLPLTDFRVRLGTILLSRQGLSSYSAPVPTGLEIFAQHSADRRKHLDIK